MSKFIRFFFYYILFWYAFFLLGRSVFLLYNFSIIDIIPFPEVLSSFYHGFSMDLAAVCYISIIPFLFSSISFYVIKRVPIRIITVYSLVIIIFCSFLLMADISLFDSWGTKINHKAIGYLAFPGEAFNAIASVPLGLISLLILLFTITTIIVYYKLLNKPVVYTRTGKFTNPALTLIGLALLFIGCRGGWQTFPVNRSWVYYSNSPVMNSAALNSFWNFLDVVSQPEMKTNPYTFFKSNSVEQIIHDYKNEASDTTISILKPYRPNIVLIILESYSAENLAILGGDSLSPGIEQLAQKGICFTNAYASGFRTEQGLVALINSFPAQPKESIMRHFEKFEILPTISQALDTIGYSNYYYYAGDIKYANTEAYLLNAGFKKITSLKNFKSPKFETRWGASDEDLFEYQLRHADSDHRPFFSIIMTSTSHEPFDAPVTKYFGEDTEVDLYKNSIRYTDSCLAAYLSAAKIKDWYNNTLFIITADHAHKYPRERSAFEPLRHKIPLFFYGGALKKEFQGAKITKPVSQVDIAPTILSQLKINTDNFFFGNNIFNPSSTGFAFYSYDNGFGLITPDKTLVYDNDMDKVIYSVNWLKNCTDSIDLNFGKAYQQKLMDNYIELNN